MNNYKLLGFRSNKVWKMILSTFYLSLCFIFAGVSFIYGRKGQITVYDFVINKIFIALILLCLLSPYIVLSDTKLRELLPLFRKHKAWISVVGMAVVFVALSLVTGAVHLCHSEEYLADAENHAYGEVSREDPTCYWAGRINYECSYCGITKHESIKATGHDMVEYSRSEATCGESGKINYRCSTCGYERTDYSSKLPHDYDEAKETHPTCTESGAITRTCKNCGNVVIEKKVGEALGHSMKEYSRTEPTRDAEGKIIYRCERCDHEETESIEKLPPLTYVEGVDFGEIYRDFKANELRAIDVYRGNRYRITAKVVDISVNELLNLFGGATLTLETRVDNTIVFIIADFGKDQEDALKTINVGDTITYEGECNTYGYWKNCEMILE